MGLKMEAIKRFVQDNDAVLWAVTFVGVCVLVGLGKVKPETIEYMMMAIVGRVASTRKASE